MRGTLSTYVGSTLNHRIDEEQGTDPRSAPTEPGDGRPMEATTGISDESPTPSEARGLTSTISYSPSHPDARVPSASLTKVTFGLPTR